MGEGGGDIWEGLPELTNLVHDNIVDQFENIKNIKFRHA